MACYNYKQCGNLVTIVKLIQINVTINKDVEFVKYGVAYVYKLKDHMY